MAVKLKWRLAEKPTGPYRSFYPRHWPQAWVDDHLVASLSSTSDRAYSRPIAESEELRIFVYDYRGGVQARAMRSLKARPVGVKAAKELVQRFYSANPDWLPKD